MMESPYGRPQVFSSSLYFLASQGPSHLLAHSATHPPSGILRTQFRGDLQPVPGTGLETELISSDSDAFRGAALIVLLTG